MRNPPPTPRVPVAPYLSHDVVNHMLPLLQLMSPAITWDDAYAFVATLSPAFIIIPRESWDRWEERRREDLRKLGIHC